MRTSTQVVAMEDIAPLLRQATAITNLLITNGQSLGGFESSHETVTNSLWAISVILEQIEAEL